MPAPEFTLGGMTPREFYAFELKRYREAMVPKMTQEQLGAVVFCSGAYIGQLETMARVPQLALSKLIDKALNTGGALERLHALMGFTYFPDYFTHAADHESRALVIEEYAGQLVPGVLQTAEYARALFSAGSILYPEKQITEMADSRIERGRRITAVDGPSLWFILDEAVLRRVIGSRQVMADQLDHVTALIKERRMVVQVVPYDAGAYPLLSGLLSLMTFEDAPPLAYSESAHAGQLLDDPPEVAKCRRAYDVARATALPARDSLEFIQSIAQGFKSDRDYKPVAEE
ncbi:helix-turn-helix domain-containing protein [Streptomyces sp. NRRL WC-3742]|uniref:helix-turn-helix domain-containing protein n=1 Tax=Streptomyces sp. NRRL WC-3742 TaxID=1463934 RepID=UPI00068D9DAF|nr:helix-turn-helix transcriptional regulator [Streptomyces sp. NRRL WC-3742]